MTDTLTEEEQADLEEFTEAWNALRLHRPDRTVDSELLLAGTFVANFGTLADWFDDNLPVVQFSQAGTSAVAFLGHWSVERGDPEDEPVPNFYLHLSAPAGFSGPAGCKICTYLEKALELHRAFDDEDCEHCGLGVGAHQIVPDGAVGEPFAACLSPWERRDPWTFTAADAGGPDQLSNVAYESRWSAKLTDNSYGVITRYFYVIDRDGEVFLEEQTEYMWCTDPAHPGDTEIDAEYTYNRVDTGDDVLDHQTDMEEYARDAEAPGLDEWRERAPKHAPDILPPE